MTDYEYRINYMIERRERGYGEDFAEIGFGSSGGWDSPEQCAHMVLTDVQHYGWETLGDYPDPQEIKAAIERVRDVP